METLKLTEQQLNKYGYFEVTITKGIKPERTDVAVAPVWQFKDEDDFHSYVKDKLSESPYFFYQRSRRKKPEGKFFFVAKTNGPDAFVITGLSIENVETHERKDRNPDEIAQRTDDLYIIPIDANESASIIGATKAGSEMIEISFKKPS